MTNQFMGKYILKGSLECLTGLHIGGSTTGLEIGGLDNPVIKDPITDQPYIPGSSLKGKLRSLLEWRWELVTANDKGKYNPYHCEDLKTNMESLRLARLFGPNSNKHDVRVIAGPTRLTVRDSFLSEESAKQLTEMLGEQIYTEIKTENALDRVTSEANPRPMERVPKGAKFDVYLILDAYQMQPDSPSKELFEALLTAMSILEHSALGGGGSRGSGQVAFHNLQITWRSAQDYAAGNPGTTVILPGQTSEAILKDFEKIQWPA
jgi:CRISPR-associated protein Csm3